MQIMYHDKNFLIRLSKNIESGYESGKKRYEKSIIPLDNIKDKSNTDPVTFNLTGQSFSIQNYAFFSLAFLNTKDIKTEPLDSSFGNPSWKLLNNNLEVIYTSQNSEGRLLIV